MKSQPNFDRVARIYRRAEYLSLGRLLERTREHYLPYLMDRRHALVLGDGDGRFLARLMEGNAGIRAVAVDLSAAMLELLRHRCAFAAWRLQTLQTPALNAEIPAGVDLVVTHFFLDCLTQGEVDELAQRVKAGTVRGALWVVSDFAVPDRPLIGVAARLYIRTLYFAFRILTGLRVTQLPDAASALTRAGFKRVERQERLYGVLYTELWQRR